MTRHRIRAVPAVVALAAGTVLALILIGPTGEAFAKTESVGGDPVKVLQRVLKHPPTTEAAIEEVRSALRALDLTPAPSIQELVLSVAGQKNLPHRVRGTAFLVLSYAPPADASQLRALAHSIVGDRTAEAGLRFNAAIAVGRRGVANESTRTLLKAVLLRNKDVGFVQRICLQALAETSTLANMKKLLLRPEIYRHPHYGVRADVCCGFAAFSMRNRDVLRILVENLSDVDPEDSGAQVPQEAWLSLWTLTGKAHGIAPASRELFLQRAPLPETETQIRKRMWDKFFVRDGVTKQMAAAVRSMTIENAREVLAAQEHGKKVVWVRNTKALKAASDAWRRELSID